MAEEYALLPCICVYAGVGYYENLPEFMHYDSTLLVTAEELADRKDVASVQSLNRVTVLIKPGVEESSVISVMQENTAWNRRKHCFPKGYTAIRSICL